MSLRVLVAALALAVLADAALVRIHHRVYHPSLPPVPFALRASVDTSGPTLDHSAGSLSDLRGFTEIARGLGHALYQVALEREGDSSQSEWSVSSVKACHLNSATSDSIIVHLSPALEPYNLDYFVFPVPHDGSCKPALANDVPSLVLSNTTLHLRQPNIPPIPQLRVPPPLDPQGQVVIPEPEQSFIQKYWVYLVGFCLVLMLAPGPPEEGQRSGPAGGAAGR